MEGFNATPEELARAGGLASTAYDEVNAELSLLRGRVGEVAGGWSGEAFGRFTSVMQRWDTSARSLSEALDSIATALRSSGVAYQAQDDETAGRLTLISETLG
jgi:WXG100 family type VII secretion target